MKKRTLCAALTVAAGGFLGLYWAHVKARCGSYEAGAALEGCLELHKSFPHALPLVGVTICVILLLWSATGPLALDILGELAEGARRE